eukprot:TRINITY_DN19552_c0_g1_i2.p1 TRINITY_DN19552_c0_g1~~TRINITY_DN19552_c0_g1_i2.p1  ORF type:complete len:295 (+),score=39.32 TRINITY_DN19552_c0_g1_i2:54-938(+)
MRRATRIALSSIKYQKGQVRFAHSTVDEDEIGRFARITPQWWDTNGPMKELHSMNPVRIGWIRNLIERELGAGAKAASPLAGIRILDIGCGAGIASEPLARLGAEVVGVDANSAAIDVANNRLQTGPSSDLKNNLSFICGAAEDLTEGEKFDVVVALEIVEHVSNVDAFVKTLSQLTRPGGLVCMSTINKTLLSYSLGIVFAERIANMVPPGTHDWNKFISPEDLTRSLRNHNVVVAEVRGMHPKPVLTPCPTYEWGISSDLSLNYILGGIRLPDEPEPELPITTKPRAKRKQK